MTAAQLNPKSKAVTRAAAPVFRPLWWKPYALSALVAVAVILVRRLLGPLPDDTAVFLAFAAVVSFAGWYAGARPAVFLTWAGAAAAGLYVLGTDPAHDAALGRVATFLAVGLLISLVVATLGTMRVRPASSPVEPNPAASAAVLGTANLRTAVALRATERHFHRMAAAVPQIFWATTADGQPDYCNRPYYDAFGFTEATVLTPAALARTIHPDDVAAYQSAWAAAAESGEPGQTEYRLKTASDDGYRWHVGRFVPVRDAAGQVERWFATGTDVEDQRRAEAGRKAAFEQLEERVRERTADLTLANAALSAEAAARQRAEANRTELQRRLATAQEEERSRIARELHDQMGQYLTALGIGLRVVSEATPPTSPEAGRILQLLNLTEVTGREVHRIAVELRPAVLDDIGLRAAVQNHLDDWAARAGVEIDYHDSGLDGDRLPKAVETVAYRVVQEALTNILRHAAASRVSVVLRRAEGHLCVVVEDDGRGFDAEAVTNPPAGGGRLGVRGMDERVTQVGGTLEIESAPGCGAVVIARIPLAAHERTDGNG